MSFINHWWDILKKDKLLRKVLTNTSYLLSSNVLSMGLEHDPKHTGRTPAGRCRIRRDRNHHRVRFHAQPDFLLPHE